LYRFVGKVKVRAGGVSALVGRSLKQSNREPGIIFQKEIACGNAKKYNPFLSFGREKMLSVVMRHACQATNQSSHGELSFHHNPHLRLCWGLRLYTSRVIRSGGARLKHAAHFTYCHCCELCALKQKPGALLENALSFGGGQKTQNPNCKPYSSPHQVPKHKMLWYIEKGTLREVGKIDA
jgi:hypothetical protein